MARWPRALILPIVLALLAAPLAHGQSTALVSSASGKVEATVQSSSVASSLQVQPPSGSTFEMMHAPSPGGGWGACWDQGTPNTCMCPYGYSTCPMGGVPFTVSAAYAAPDYTTVHTGGALEVRHVWGPTGSAPPYNDMLSTVVTVKNVSNQTIDLVGYRVGEALRFESPVPFPNGGWATMTIGTNNAAQALQTLKRSSDLGMANPTPGAALGDDPYNNNGQCGNFTVGPGSASGGPWFSDLPEASRNPCQPGGMAELDLGVLAPGMNRSFEMVRGIAPNETAAQQRLGPAYLNATFWFLAQSWNPNQAVSGTPFTYFWAFRMSPGALGNGCATTPNCNDNSGNGNSTCTPNTCPCPAPSNCGCPSTPNCNPGNGTACQHPCGGNTSSGCTPNGCPSSPYPNQSNPQQSQPPPPSPGQSPSAHFWASGSFATPGQEVTFWDGSVDADGTVVAAHWDFGDGTTATGATAAHSWALPGRYVVRLTAFDDSGLSVSATMEVEVGPAQAATGSQASAPGAGTIAPASPGPVRLVSSMDGCGPGTADCGTSPGTAAGAAPRVQPRLEAVVAEQSQVMPLLLAAAALAAAGVLVAQRRRWWPLALLLFSRIERGDVLDHPARSRLVELIEAEPGVHVRELTRRSNLSRSGVEHHLRVLVGAGLVKTVAAGGLVRCFPGPQAAPSEPGPGPAARRILEAAAASQGLTVSEVAERAGMGYGAAHYHLRRLEKAGLVRLRDEVGLRVFAMAPAAVSPGRPASAVHS